VLEELVVLAGVDVAGEPPLEEVTVEELLEVLDEPQPARSRSEQAVSATEALLIEGFLSGVVRLPRPSHN
jgi:hypothetical protein